MDVDKKVVFIGGLPVNVYGLEFLAPPVNGTVPDVHVMIYLHGRTRSAMNEEPIVEIMYGNVRQYMTKDPQGSKKDLLIASFDQPNHGARMTDPLEQDGFDSGNKDILMDQFAMMERGESDTKNVLDFLPAILFPMDERQITGWSVMGRSMGGHTSWRVLAADPRVTVGVSCIGTPDYYNLMEGRAALNKVPLKPPSAPASFVRLVNATGPVNTPYTSYNATNPFWGKKIFAASGEKDPVVSFAYSRSFLEKLVLGPKDDPLTNESFMVYVQPSTKHQVTTEMLELAGRWVYRWGIAEQPTPLEPKLELRGLRVPGPPPRTLDIE
ncbi:hypothetical protein MVES1_001826 [Malassezia vespertilionis]|uniref:AB hydrolase-1 domain-containing protein n=1 Tax=Malassezia vespertilionis TaxID=2020962 RepID=A0A2N1JD82_9BASI|nr:uncharacterized protein MVES1_001826 [Malassezia vespertilionis]PKI84508.1 hypothetical protein MVES_001727 [Malassezia vespertilionis]WFD06481.1 hypothetical protein MVES1_001826 [Malassezia vespertilionis]